eukprot:TRINITY_DN9101_c0_g1_i1.p2 TRINITY_DN9101_c0_g1~~TRINITY_DN9101_c0_g1_i1.p2  ORF type:complete len:144 (-),score=6.50 TRINITY_DN9101_c0_g1_i1:53-484(-)
MAAPSFADVITSFFKPLGSNPEIPQIDWVLYEHGTFVALPATQNSRDELIANCNEALHRFRQVIAGTPLGDFSVGKREEYDQAVYVVDYCTYFPDPFIATIFIDSEMKMSEIAVGLTARQIRTKDAADKKVILTAKDLADGHR